MMTRPISLGYALPPTTASAAVIESHLPSRGDQAKPLVSLCPAQRPRPTVWAIGRWSNGTSRGVPERGQLGQDLGGEVGTGGRRRVHPVSQAHHRSVDGPGEVAVRVEVLVERHHRCDPGIPGGNLLDDGVELIDPGG